MPDFLCRRCQQAHCPVSKSRSFWAPRLLHHWDNHDLPPPAPGRPPVSDWRNPHSSTTARIRRQLVPRCRQSHPSPRGLSKLPYEVLQVIFDDLCGREISACRLVCVEWESTSRPFFALHYLAVETLLMWLIRPHLRILERFGPWIRRVDFATDAFAFRGLISVVIATIRREADLLRSYPGRVKNKAAYS
jgi:hypothetical protein